MVYVNELNRVRFGAAHIKSLDYKRDINKIDKIVAIGITADMAYNNLAVRQFRRVNQIDLM